MENKDGALPAEPDRATHEPNQQAVSAVPVGIRSADVDPIILVALGDLEQKPRLYACGKCGSVHSPTIYLATKERAHEVAMEAARDCYNCKTHNICSECGEQCPKGWTACDACRFQKRLAAATEVPDNGGPYCAFDGDTYFSEMEEAIDAGLEWVSPCDVTYPRIDAYSVLENLLDDMHEDASVDDLDATDAFEAACKAFNEAQKTQSWFGDSKRKIRVPAQAIEARSGETGTGSTEGESAVSEGDAPNSTAQEQKP